MTLSEIIKKYRKENKISMSSFSKKAGISKSYIGFIENGINPATNKPIVPSIDMITKLASAMGMSTDELIRALDDAVEINIQKSKKLLLTDEKEIQIIENYRVAPIPTKQAIDVLLGVNEDENEEEKENRKQE